MPERVHAHAKIKPIWDSAVTEVLSRRKKQDKVTGVKLKNLKTGAESILPCAGVFIAIGHGPNTELFKGKITTDTNGFIVPKAGTMTNVPGVFVAGDTAPITFTGRPSRPRARGCAAAIDAERFLSARNE